MDGYTTRRVRTLTAPVDGDYLVGEEIVHLRAGDTVELPLAPGECYCRRDRDGRVCHEYPCIVEIEAERRGRRW